MATEKLGDGAAHVQSRASRVLYGRRRKASEGVSGPDWAGSGEKREGEKRGLRPVPSFSSFAIVFFQGIKEREEKREK